MNRPVLAPRKGTSPRSRRRRQWAFTLPAVLFLGIFSLYPLVQLLRMSVSKVSSRTLQQDSWEFAGVENFVTGALQGDLGGAIIKTAVFVVVVTVLGLAGGLGAAILLASNARGTGFLLGLMVFIWALPPVVNGSVWKFLLGDAGLINTLLQSLGSAASVPFLYDERLALMSVAVVNSWAVVPFNALVCRAAIFGISPDVFEAARMDGANRWQEIRHIILPGVRPSMLVLTVLTIVYAFRSFDFIYVMTFGGPGTATNTLPFLSYLQAFVRYDYGLGAATAVIALVLILALAITYARSIRNEESH